MILPTDKPERIEIDVLEKIRSDLKNAGYNRVEVLGGNFMESSSAEEYGVQWITRELGQNFTDANKQHPGTINGVEIQQHRMPDGNIELTIEGNWPFIDPTPIMTFDGAKVNTKTSAGGNSAGFKQVATLLTRDPETISLTVTGENWEVDYKEHIEGSQQDGSEKKWIVACCKKVENSGRCKYRLVVRPNHPIVSEFQNFKNMFVCEENIFLQSPSFKNNQLIICWGENRESEGRFFIAGQVNNWGKKIPGKWLGPKGGSFAVSNIDEIGVQRTLDRSFVEETKIGKLFQEAVEKLTPDECETLIRSSEHLWAGDESCKFDFDASNYLLLIKLIIEKIKKLNRDFNITSIIGSKKYAAIHYEDGEDVIKKAKEAGYIICPSFFGGIGMQKTNMLGLETDTEQAMRGKPKIDSTIKKLYGYPVATLGIECTHVEEYWHAWAGCGQMKIGDNEQVCIMLDELRGKDAETSLLKTRMTKDEGKFQNIVNLLAEGLRQGWMGEPCFISTPFGMFVYEIDEHGALMCKRDEKVKGKGEISFKCLERVQSLRQMINSGGQAEILEALKRKQIEEEAKKLQDEKEKREKEEAKIQQKVQQEVQKALAESEKALAEARAEKNRFEKEKNELLQEKDKKEREKKIQEDAEKARQKEQKAQAENGKIIEKKEMEPDKGQKKHSRGRKSRMPVYAALASGLGLLTVTQWPSIKHILGRQGVGIVQSGNNGEKDPNKNKKTDAPPMGLSRQTKIADPVKTTNIYPIGGGSKTSMSSNSPIQRVETTPKLNTNSATIPNTGIKNTNPSPTNSNPLRVTQNNPNNSSPKQSQQTKPGMAGESQEGSQLSRTDISITKIGGQSISSLVEGYNQPNIPESTKQDRAGVSQNEPGSSEDIEDFEIIINSNANVRENLNTLILFAHYTTGVNINHKFFIFRGKGARGINIGKKSIGIHEELLNGNIFDALLTMIHEICHTETTGHGSDFRASLQALTAQAIANYDTCARKYSKGLPLTEREENMLACVKKWQTKSALKQPQ